MPDDLTPTERTLLDMNNRGCTQEQCATALRCGDRKIRNMLYMLVQRGHPVVSRRTGPSVRPQQVANMLNAGMTLSDIAAELGLSVGTVQDYQYKAKKLGFALPPPIGRYADEHTLETLRREIQSIHAPAVVFEGNVFDDVRLKRTNR